MPFSGSGAMSGAASGAAMGTSIMPGWGTVIGGVAGGLMGGFMGGGKDPSHEANKYYNQIPGTIKPYFDPYINKGRRAMNQSFNQYHELLGNRQGIQDQYNQLMNDPNGVMGRIGAGYQQSPGYQWQMDQAMNAANNAAATGGMAGSPQHQQQAATMAQGLANQDYYNYMNKALGLYGQGLQGNTNLYGMGLQGMQDINHMGYGASGDLAGMLATNLMNQGNMAYSGGAAQNQSQGASMGNAFGTLAAWANNRNGGGGGSYQSGGGSYGMNGANGLSPYW